MPFSSNFLHYFIHSICVSSPVVTPIDDQPPKVKYLAKKVNVFERGIKTLTKDILSGTDEDTDDEMLAFLVVSGPNQGVIQKQGKSSLCTARPDYKQ